MTSVWFFPHKKEKNTVKKDDSLRKQIPLSKANSHGISQPMISIKERGSQECFHKSLCHEKSSKCNVL
jgi:hypothetical protein